MQTYATVYDPSRSGETRVPMSSIALDPPGERRVMARRAAFELLPGDVVSLGVGVSAMIPSVVAEEGIADLITLTVEAGVVGGVPGHGREFGTAINPRAIIDQGYQFDFYEGGGLSCAFLSFAEVDAAGNVNATRFGNRFAGAGGFIDITQNTHRLVFSGSLTGGGLRVDLAGDGLAIRQKGGLRKVVSAVEQVSFSGARARTTGQHVTFVTRARGVRAAARRRDPDRDRPGDPAEAGCAGPDGLPPPHQPGTAAAMRRLVPPIFLQPSRRHRVHLAARSR